MTVAENALLYFMAAADGKLTSESVEVDGAPLSAPEVSVDADGKLTVTAAAADAAVTGLEFWYLIDSDDFETGTPTKYEASAAPKLNDGQTCYVVAAAEMRNPSTPAVYNVEAPPEEKPTAPIVTDSRTASGTPGSYFNPTVTKPGSYVFYAKTAGGTESDKKTVEVKVLQEPTADTSASIPKLVSPDGGSVLYELSDNAGGPAKNVTADSPVFTGSGISLSDLGKILTAVSVKEFCFSSEQIQVPLVIRRRSPIRGRQAERPESISIRAMRAAVLHCKLPPRKRIISSSIKKAAETKRRFRPAENFLSKKPTSAFTSSMQNRQ